MALAVFPADPSDAAAIADLMEELDRFYGGTSSEPLADRVAQVEAMLFGATPAAYVLLARDNDVTVGLAAYSFLWPAVGLTRSLYLKELYVRQAHHRRGIGTALMRAICAVAADNNCSRVEWTTENTNKEAMDFYQQLPAPANPVKLFYRLDADDVRRLASL